MTPKIRPSWNALMPRTTPRWLAEAKFGIYTHWGVYCVPASGPNVTWYPHLMYREGTPQFDHHVKTYGHPSKFGYKDFIPMFTGEKFDADEWAACFRNAGAKFAGPVGEHHDGFCMWDTRLTPWNATRMGPKQDVVGKLEQAIRKQGMKFLVALHHAENWWFFPHWRKEFDTSDPEYAGLYGTAHNLDGDVGSGFFDQAKPDQAFLETWTGKIIEVIDRYGPDMLWFDFGLRGIHEHYKKQFLAYYYNWAQERNKEVVVTYKFDNIVPGTGLVDLELGRMGELTAHDWLTDTTVDNGEGWGYLHDTAYKPVVTLVHYLIDNVSKNGYLLLNVGPKPNGEIPEEAKAVLAGIGQWLEVNGEAIYGTTPWLVYGEGPTKMEKSGAFCEDKEVQYTAKDIRFTSKEDTLYAICLGWPVEPVKIAYLKDAMYASEIRSIRMLGSDRDLEWKMGPDGLTIIPPETKPCDHAVVFKIARRPPFNTNPAIEIRNET